MISLRRRGDRALDGLAELGISRLGGLVRIPAAPSSREQAQCSDPERPALRHALRRRRRGNFSRSHVDDAHGDADDQLDPVAPHAGEERHDEAAAVGPPAALRARTASSIRAPDSRTPADSAYSRAPSILMYPSASRPMLQPSPVEHAVLAGGHEPIEHQPGERRSQVRRRQNRSCRAWSRSRRWRAWDGPGDRSWQPGAPASAMTINT